MAQLTLDAQTTSAGCTTNRYRYSSSRKFRWLKSLKGLEIYLKDGKAKHKEMLEQKNQPQLAACFWTMESLAQFYETSEHLRSVEYKKLRREVGDKTQHCLGAIESSAEKVIDKNAKDIQWAKLEKKLKSECISVDKVIGEVADVIKEGNHRIEINLLNNKMSRQMIQSQLYQRLGTEYLFSTKTKLDDFDMDMETSLQKLRNAGVFTKGCMNCKRDPELQRKYMLAVENQKLIYKDKKSKDCTKFNEVILEYMTKLDCGEFAEATEHHTSKQWMHIVCSIKPQQKLLELEERDSLIGDLRNTQLSDANLDAHNDDYGMGPYSESAYCDWKCEKWSSNLDEYAKACPEILNFCQNIEDLDKAYYRRRKWLKLRQLQRVKFHELKMAEKSIAVYNKMPNHASRTGLEAIEMLKDASKCAWDKREKHCEKRDSKMWKHNFNQIENNYSLYEALDLASANRKLKDEDDNASCYFEQEYYGGGW